MAIRSFAHSLKRLLIVAFLFVPILPNAQYLGIQRHDTDGYTFIREGQGTTAPIVDILFNGEFFRFYPDNSSDWTKVDKKFFTGIRSTGYVRKSKIINLNTLDKHDQNVLLDSIYDNEVELQNKYSHKSREYFSVCDKFHEEKFDLLLPVLCPISASITMSISWINI